MKSPCGIHRSAKYHLSYEAIFSSSGIAMPCW